VSPRDAERSRAPCAPWSRPAPAAACARIRGHCRKDRHRGNRRRPAHAWFTGFAPYGGQRRSRFAVIVENAGYGGRAAAPIAGAIVSAASELGLIK
jgi:cell division protein FtsI/penicillin-binding protein 2